MIRKSYSFITKIEDQTIWNEKTRSASPTGKLIVTGSESMTTDGVGESRSLHQTVEFMADALKLIKEFKQNKWQ